MAFAKGKYAKAISDRSGMEFPYNEMIREWNGSFVHRSEYELRHPQDEARHYSVEGFGPNMPTTVFSVLAGLACLKPNPSTV